MSEFDAPRELEDLREVAKTFGPDPAFDFKMRHFMLRSIEPFLRAGNCLQVGCGYGVQTCLLARRFADLSVVEAVPDLIESTRRLAVEQGVAERINFIEGLIQTVDITERFDNIVISHTLEHMPDDQAVIGRLLNLLKPGGRLFIICPNARAASRQIAVEMGILKSRDDLVPSNVLGRHKRVYDMEALCGVVEKSGGAIVEKGGILFKALANFQFNKMMEQGIIDDAYLEGCYEFGKKYPELCASVFVVAEKK